MQHFKISLITVTYNAESTICRCIESVIAQNYSELEYIVIDGGSTDNTLQLIGRYKNHINILVSEADKGIYDAMNKGIRLAHGEIIGTLNSDDFFAFDDILSTIAATFDQKNTAIVYGNLDYVKLNETIIRKWRTRAYVKGMFNWGWMPPHPTFYCKRVLFFQYGFYSLTHGTAVDYELMLRFMHTNNATASFINRVLVKMQCGGLSNKNPGSRLKAWGFDLQAMRDNGVLYPFLTLVMKPLRKISQYL